MLAVRHRPGESSGRGITCLGPFLRGDPWLDSRFAPSTTTSSLAPAGCWPSATARNGDGAGFLGFAAVLPDARGVGAGRALGETVLAWARDAGHATIVTDWRSTNVESNRAWLALGFRPIFHRLHRAIG